jgi:hypothetical protein
MKSLTLQMLKDMEPGIFATGTVSDNPVGVNMTNSGKLLRWVAVRGGIHDWKIYCHWAEHDEQWIKAQGDKITNEDNIRKLVPCDDEAFGMYAF